MLHPRRFGFLVFCAIIVAGPAGRMCPAAPGVAKWSDAIQTDAEATKAKVVDAEELQAVHPKYDELLADLQESK